MTTVSVLCLNHREHFSIVWSSDVFGENRISICHEAYHRYFHFYGGTVDREFFIWLYPMKDFQMIRKSIHKEIYENMSKTSKKKIIQTLEFWEYLITEGFNPEYFLQKPKEIGFAYDKIEKVANDTPIDFEEIKNTLLINKDPIDEEPKEITENIEEQFKVLKEAARKRYCSCVYLQWLNRDYEEEFFDFLLELQITSILERKVLAIFALHYYQIKRIKNSQRFFEFIKKNLASDIYLIRKETQELLKSAFIFNPDLVLSFVENFLLDSDINNLLLSIGLLKEYYNILEAVLENDLELTTVVFPHDHRLNSTYYSKLAPLFEIALEKQKKFMEQLFQKNTYWKKKKWEIPLPENLIEYSNKDKLMFYARSLNCLKIIAEPFKLIKKK